MFYTTDSTDINDAQQNWKTEEDHQECLTEKVCEQDKKNGGSGIAMVSCPCPKCSPRF